MTSIHIMTDHGLHRANLLMTRIEEPSLNYRTSIRKPLILRESKEIERKENPHA